MSRDIRRTTVRALVLATALAVAGTAALPADAGVPATAGVTSSAGPAATTQVVGKRGDGSVVRHVVLSWKGGTKNKRRAKTFAIPGIGQMTFTCNPKNARISIRANHRDRETQMWMAKYEDKNYGQAVAVKTVRVFRYAHVYDSGKGGTANPQHEGLNQRGGKVGIENYGKGYAHGIISQRGGRNTTVGNDPLTPVTTFDVNWFWNGMDYPAQYRSCKIDGVFVTRPARTGVNWHGEADAQGHEARRIRVPDLGAIDLRCEPGRFGRQTVTIDPDNPATKAFVETIEGEGRVDNHVDTRNRVTDPETGLIGPIELPTNGMMRFFFTTGSRTVPFILSSYQKLNDPNKVLNTCEVAMAPFPK